MRSGSKINTGFHLISRYPEDRTSAQVCGTLPHWVEEHRKRMSTQNIDGCSLLINLSTTISILCLQFQWKVFRSHLYSLPCSADLRIYFIPEECNIQFAVLSFYSITIQQSCDQHSRSQRFSSRIIQSAVTRRS